MKVLFFHASFAFWTTLLLLSTLPSLSLACRCMPIVLNETLYSTEDNSTVVVAGRIIDELKPADTGATVRPSRRFFAFTVKQVYKSCSVQINDTIIVSTSSSSASCGLYLQPNTGYIFAGYAAVEDDTSSQPIFQISVGLCNYHAQLPVSAADKQVLRQYRDTENVARCSRLTTSNVVVPYTTPCQTGASCDPTREYCDAAINQCVAVNSTTASCPCPADIHCKAPPCSVTEPCEEATAAVGPVTCIDNYCCGCNAIFLNGERTRICNVAGR